MKAACEETSRVEELADNLQKQCSLVSSQVMQDPSTSTGALSPSVSITTSEQLRQLLTLLSQKNDSWSLSPNDKQLVVTDELQSSISKVCPRMRCCVCVTYKGKSR